MSHIRRACFWLQASFAGFSLWISKQAKQAIESKLTRSTLPRLLLQFLPWLLVHVLPQRQKHTRVSDTPTSNVLVLPRSPESGRTAASPRMLERNHSWPLSSLKLLLSAMRSYWDSPSGFSWRGEVCKLDFSSGS